MNVDKIVGASARPGGNAGYTAIQASLPNSTRGLVEASGRTSAWNWGTSVGKPERKKKSNFEGTKLPTERKTLPLMVESFKGVTGRIEWHNRVRDHYCTSYCRTELCRRCNGIMQPSHLLGKRFTRCSSRHNRHSRHNSRRLLLERHLMTLQVRENKTPTSERLPFRSESATHALVQRCTKQSSMCKRQLVARRRKIFSRNPEN